MGDYDTLKTEDEVESLITLDELVQVRTEANEIVLSDRQKLTEDRDQFSSEQDKCI